MVDRVADLQETDRAELRALSLAVYPPDETDAWPGRTIEWSPADWCVRVRDGAGTLVSYVGITLRDGERDATPVRIGGIGGVKTHPAARGHGHAAHAIASAVAFFHERHVDFGLLVCAPTLLEYYARLGWRPFTGRLIVRQRGTAVDFTLNRAMTLAVDADAPRDGTIDLLGPPW